MSRKIAVPFSSFQGERLERIRAAATGFEVVDLAEYEANGALAEIEVMMGHVGPDIIKEARNLKWLHTQSAGVDNYLAPEMGLSESVLLTNSSGAYGIGISEHLVTVTMMLLRRMGEYVRLQCQSEWRGVGAVRAIYGSVVTVVGLGDIGGNYAARCRALGAVVRGVVRSARSEKPDCVDALYTADKLDEALAGADVIALCLPGTKETTNLLSRECLQSLKKGAIILNVGRGTAIDQDALIELLESGHLGGAGLDVTTPEPLPKDSKLWGMPNVILTPHVSGGMSLGITLDLIAERFAAYLKDYIEGRAFQRVVDREAGY